MGGFIVIEQWTLGAGHYLGHVSLEEQYSTYDIERKVETVVIYEAANVKDLEHHYSWWKREAIVRQQLRLTNPVKIEHLNKYLAGTICTECSAAMPPDTKWCPHCLNKSFKRGPVFERVIWDGRWLSVPPHPSAVAKVMMACEEVGVPFEFAGWGDWQPYDVDYPEPKEKRIIVHSGHEITQRDLEALRYPNVLAPVVMGNYSTAKDSERPNPQLFMGQKYDPPERIYMLSLFNKKAVTL